MAFDLLAWLLDAGLSASAEKLGKRMWGRTLNTDLAKALSTWASQLPDEAQLHPAALFPQQVDHEELVLRPALAALQNQLQHRRIPTLVQWHQALIEHWLRVRAHAGADAQAFFRLSEDDVRPRLFDLARALVQVCENDEGSFRSAAMEHLEAIRESSPLLPLPLQHARDVDVKGLAARIADMGISVFMILHDLPARTLTLWVHVPCSTMAELKAKWAAIVVVASSAPGVEYIDVGTCYVSEMRGTDAQGQVGTMRVRIPLAAAKELAATRRLTPDFWQHAQVFIIRAEVDNTGYQSWVCVPFSNLEVPLAASR